MLTEKGNAILKEIFDEVRKDFLKDNPGSNENDVERNFLYVVFQGVNDSHYTPQYFKDKVEEIR